MVDRIAVDVAAVEALAGRLDRVARALEDVLRVVGPGWEQAGAAVGGGDLGAALTEAGQDWTRYAVALGVAVDALGRGTREAAVAYGQVEDRVSLAWGPTGGRGSA